MRIRAGSRAHSRPHPVRTTRYNPAVIPDPLDKPAIAQLATEALALGEPATAVAVAVGCSERTVRRFREANSEAIDRLKAQAIEEGERSGRFRRMIRALLRAGRDTANRGQAQAARVYGEYIGAVGGTRDVTINGDVSIDQSTVNVDARTVTIARDASARRAELGALERDLGIG